MIKITPDNTVTLFNSAVDVTALEIILKTLREHGSVYVSINNFNRNSHPEVPTLAEIVFVNR